MIAIWSVFIQFFRWDVKYCASKHHSLIFTGGLTITGTCGGTYDNNKNEITTPNYPRNYPENKLCNWNIEVTQGQYIELEFNVFELEYSRTCGDYLDYLDHDYLEVYDGRSSSSPNLGKYCGYSKPGKIISGGNTLFLYWRSDSSHFADFQASGFNISASTKLIGKYILKYFQWHIKV